MSDAVEEGQVWEDLHPSIRPAWRPRLMRVAWIRDGFAGLRAVDGHPHRSGVVSLVRFADGSYRLREEGP